MAGPFESFIRKVFKVLLCLIPKTLIYKNKITCANFKITLFFVEPKLNNPVSQSLLNAFP